MKVSTLLEQRKPNWDELERLTNRLQSRRGKLSPEEVNRFVSLYRSACADLALASSYQLPPTTVEYLNKLVGRAHNQLYRGRDFRWKTWADALFVYTPQKIFGDICVHICFFVFWGLFLLSALLAYDTEHFPGFAEQILTPAGVEGLQSMYEDFGGRTYGENSTMAGFYVWNNAGIGLKCFASMLLIVPGFLTLAYNAVALGTSFGLMFRPDAGEAGVNFKTFVTAHGPFELTAIILSAAAGLRIGISWIKTGGLTRMSSLFQSGKDALPIVMAAVVMFVMAACIEGFISPTPEAYMPWWIKGSIAVISCGLLMFYFVVLGYPRPMTQKGLLDEV